MTSAPKVSSAVSFRYAIALIDLATDSKSLDKVEKDIADLSAMISASADLSLLIHSPLVGNTKKSAALLAIADKAKFQDLTKNFLGVAAENGRSSALPGIIEAFYSELSKRRGEVTVNVQTAQNMSAKQKKALQDSISKAVGSDVSVQATVDPSILGGMIVTVGSQMIDDSVARKLERLKAAMSKQSNENTVTNLKEA